MLKEFLFNFSKSFFIVSTLVKKKSSEQKVSFHIFIFSYNVLIFFVLKN